MPEVMLCCRSDEALEVAATFLMSCLCDGDYMHEEAWSDRMCLVMTTRHLSDEKNPPNITFLWLFKTRMRGCTLLFVTFTIMHC